MSRVAWLLGMLAAAAGPVGGVQDVPPELSALIARARIDGTVAAWCRADYVAGRPGAFAVAVAAGTEGGEYLAVERDGRVMVLGSFERQPDLSCYTRAAARKLDAAMRQSQTIQGSLTPRWNTTVVCGFTNDTSAVCWQYSSSLKRFVPVGGWTT